VVKPSDQEEVSSGGILLPDTAKERPQEGKVIAAGPGRVTDEGKTIPMEIQVGDLVVYSRYAGTEWKDTDNEEVLIMRESDVLGKIS
jgi:chaperonin GroES